MSVREKFAQLQSVGPGDLLEDGQLSAKGRHLLQHGIGGISRLAGASGMKATQAARAASQIQMYLRENTRLGIPALLHEESLSGAMYKGATIFPQAIALASSFNPDLVKGVASCIREEMLAVGARCGLSPVLDLGREPRWGRIEETYGEDPFLVTSIARAYLHGLRGDNEKTGVIGTAKHFVAHGIPVGGLNHGSVSVGQRELRRSHLLPYQVLIEEGCLHAVMAGYHDIDGTPCTSATWLLTDLLREEWGFDGIVVSDYSGIKMLATQLNVCADETDAAARALVAGMDMELPQIECFDDRFLELFTKKRIDIEYLDRAVGRVLRIKERLGLISGSKAIDISPSLFTEHVQSSPHAHMAVTAAAESTVLLRNEDGFLPLTTDLKRIAVIGPSADSTRNLIGDYAYPVRTEFPEEHVPISTIYREAKNRWGEAQVVEYLQGCQLFDNDTTGISEAVKLAGESDVAIVCIGGRSGRQPVQVNPEIEGVDSFDRLLGSESEGEGHDRTDLRLPAVQRELIRRVTKTGTAVVAVVLQGRPPIIGSEFAGVKAILLPWLPGQGGPEAIIRIIDGSLHPGGRLPVSLPISSGQLPVYFGRSEVVASKTYVDTPNHSSFPFGFGLSYSTFDYSDLELCKESGGVRVRCMVENTGTIDSAEVVQVYLKRRGIPFVDSDRDLVDFQKIRVAAGSKVRYETHVPANRLSVLDETLSRTTMPRECVFQVGSSSNGPHVIDSVRFP